MIPRFERGAIVRNVVDQEAFVMRLGLAPGSCNLGGGPQGGSGRTLSANTGILPSPALAPRSVD